ncbi:MAG: hypothetical protein IJ571_02740 [Ruminococcus sp.]|nr:hypothetical protein [Ruminococcus sp.]
MADAKELEKIEQAEEYFRRYFEMENAVTVNEENMEYLKTYIHDDQYVTKNFNMMDQTQRGAIITSIITVVMLLVMGVAANWLIAGALAVATIVVGVIVVLRLNKYRLDVAKKEQREVNEGIREQIVLLEDRKLQLERQKDDYYKALGKRVDVPLDYMSNVGQIKKFMTDGEADTVEEAIEMFEQSLLMQQMTDIMKASEKKEEEPKQSDRERFGDPLKIIKENKRKKRREKKEKKAKK